jgi:hypothetical protein
MQCKHPNNVEVMVREVLEEHVASAISVLAAAPSSMSLQLHLPQLVPHVDLIATI